MGIRNLESYIEERTSGVRRDVNIIKVAEKSPRSNVLIIDLNCVLRSSYSNLDLVNGGDFAHFQERWNKFIKNLEKAGIEPIFCIDGPTYDDKRVVWLNRRTQIMEKFVFPIFDTLELKNINGLELAEVLKWNTTAIPNLEISSILRYFHTR